jgi:hypothetical protein
VELDVVHTEYSPGVRRMMALVGSHGSFAQGREQLETLAGLQVTTKAVERQAEAIGGDIAAVERTERERALQLELATLSGPQIPVLYIEMDGTGVPMVAAELKERNGKIAGEKARTREAKLGCVFTQTRPMKKVIRSGMKLPQPTPELSRRQRNSDCVSARRPGKEAGAVPGEK